MVLLEGGGVTDALKSVQSAMTNAMMATKDAISAVGNKVKEVLPGTSSAQLPPVAAQKTISGGRRSHRNRRSKKSPRASVRKTPVRRSSARKPSKRRLRK